MTTLDHALKWLRAGISVIPIARDGMKRPTLPWGPYKGPDGRYATEDEARHWWGRPEPLGIAACCGMMSGGLEVIDFDREANVIYPAWRSAVEQECPGLTSRVPTHRTPRRPAGWHVCALCPDMETPGTQKLAIDPALPGDQRTLVETRGEGGYFVVPGTPGACHPTGGTWEHHSGPRLWDRPTVSVEERDVMMRCARLFDRSPPKIAHPHPARREGEGLRPGEDFDRRGPDWAEILEPHGWIRAYASGTERRWRRPGKDRGWSATTGFCTAKRDGADLLRVFSSNAQPLEDGKAYGKFAAHGLLEFGGDFSACATDLYARGFGERRERRAIRAPTPQEIERVVAVCLHRPALVLSALLQHPDTVAMLRNALERNG